MGTWERLTEVPYGTGENHDPHPIRRHEREIMSYQSKFKLSPEEWARLGFVRRHNDIGWFWCAEGSTFDEGCKEYTAKARERGDLPPEEQDLT